MKIAIMQPYLFPYIGYWQLLKSVDKFVIFDDVNYINKGYINRNSILVGNKPYKFTLELKGASQNKLINELQIGQNTDKILKTIEHNYKKAPNFSKVFPLLDNVFTQTNKNLAKFIGFSIKTVLDYTQIDTQLIYSSEIQKKNDLKNQNKIIDICERLKATEYINLKGGVKLYNKEKFLSKNIKLCFIETVETKYKQFNNEFIPFLSIIDVMMFNNINKINEILNSYKIIK